MGIINLKVHRLARGQNVIRTEAEIAAQGGQSTDSILKQEEHQVYPEFPLLQQLKGNTKSKRFTKRRPADKDKETSLVPDTKGKLKKTKDQGNTTVVKLETNEATTTFEVTKPPIGQVLTTTKLESNKKPKTKVRFAAKN